MTESLFCRIDRIVAGEGIVASDIAIRTRSLQTLASEQPVCEKIARVFDRASSRVTLVTGFVVPGLLPQGENDGPLGTVALARALHLCGHRPTVLVEPVLLETTRWLAAELGCAIPIHALDPADRGAHVAGTDIGVAVEKPGRNECGWMHTFDGRRIVGGSIAVDDLFRELRDSGRMTIGIGDRGNEVGFGSLREEILRLVPEASSCGCGCGGGLVSTTETSIVYPAAVSNWGAYGVAAALGMLCDCREAIVQPDEERRMLRIAAVRGCRDGVKRRGAYGVDGISGEDSVRVVAELAEVAEAYRQ